tara:strand:+ start:282 stop:530 length:249 start_codon:yes stop_codon:yes gene_type:complete
MENMKMIKCIKCKEDMPELRLTKFGYEVCVNCSTTGAYKAVSTINGVGDHTWNDIQIMTADQAENLLKQPKSKGFDSYSSIE